MMAKQSQLASMGVEELLKLRDAVTSVLGHKTSELQQQLQRLEGFGGTRGRPAGNGRSAKGSKLPPKYRDTEDSSNVWAGRGARPRWMEERIKAGAKQEDFLINGSASPRAGRRGKKAAAAKRGRKTKKAA
jgi:DNA-binding protein H-NS